MIKKKKLEEYQSIAIELALSSGKFLQTIISDPSIIIPEEVSREDSPQTQYDEIVGQRISSVLKRETGLEAFTEEVDQPSTRIKQETFWWIDPIDGTGSYVKKEKFYGISIGLVHQECPILGIIYQPHQDRNRLYSAIGNQGAFIQENNSKKRLYVSDRTGKDLIGVLGRSQDIKNIYEDLEAKILGPFGGFTYKSCIIAEGEADIYIKIKNKKGDVRCNEWDCCAADVILKEAGGKLTNIFGEDITYNNYYPRLKEGIIISNGNDHERIIDFLQNNYILDFLQEDCVNKF